MSGETLTAQVVVASTSGCPHCRRVKAALEQASVPFQTLDVEDDPGLRDLVRKAAGRSSVPQVFVGSECLGGADDTIALLADGSLQALLGDAALRPALPPDLAAALSQQQQQEQARASAAASGALDAPLPGAARLEALNDLAARMQDPATGVPRQQLHPGQRGSPLVFTAPDAERWLEQSGAAVAAGGERDSAGPSGVPPAAATAADAVCQELLEAHLVAFVSASPPSDEDASFLLRQESAVGASSSTPPRLYVLVADALAAPTPARSAALNARFWWHGPARPALQVGTELRRLILRLYDAHLAPDGQGVSYRSMVKDPLFLEYRMRVAELQKVDLSPLGRDELLCLFINLYNALIIHALADQADAAGDGPVAPQSAAQRSAFFTTVARYRVGGHDYSADAMENGVMRGDRPSASSLGSLLPGVLPGIRRTHFKRGDPRALQVVRPLDPRIHAALVCGAKSCPPIKLYTPAALEEGLTSAMAAFCTSGVVVHPTKPQVTLSMIFKWYAVDFGGSKAERLRWLLPFLEEPHRARLGQLLNSGGGDVRIEWAPYDWSLNSHDA